MGTSATPRIERTLLAAGIATAGGGLYLFLAGLGLVPMPGEANGPMWLVACAGFAFFVAGIGVILAGLGETQQNGDLPPGAPLWAKVTSWLCGVAIASALAVIGTWVAFGGGTRHFSISGFISGPVGEIVGRSVFGFGAVLAWLTVIALAYGGAKKIFGSRSGNPAP